MSFYFFLLSSIQPCHHLTSSLTYLLLFAAMNYKRRSPQYLQLHTLIYRNQMEMKLNNPIFRGRFHHHHLIICIALFKILLNCPFFMSNHTLKSSLHKCQNSCHRNYPPFFLAHPLLSHTHTYISIAKWLTAKLLPIPHLYIPQLHPST